MAGLLRTMLRHPLVKHVRLNARPNIVKGFDVVLQNFTAPGVLVPLTRTCGWSDCPHVASADYYRNFVIPINRRDHNQGRRKFMEESIHYSMQKNGGEGGCWDMKRKIQRGESPPWPSDFPKYGTFLYGFHSPHDGSYTLHNSLRGNMPQWGLTDEGTQGSRARHLRTANRRMQNSNYGPAGHSNRRGSRQRFGKQSLNISSL